MHLYINNVHNIKLFHGPFNHQNNAFSISTQPNLLFRIGGLKDVK